MNTDNQAYILELPLSSERKQRFLESYRADRTQTSTISKLFQRVDAFVQEPEINTSHLYGFDLLIRKEPFCDLPNWGEHRTWGFAVAAERYLMKEFRLLLGGVEEETFPRMEPDKLSDAMTGATNAGITAGYQPSLVVLSGEIAPDEVVELHSSGLIRPTWGNPSQITSPWILGLWGNLPVLHLREADVQTVHSVDLARFATLTQYNDIEFAVTEIDQQQARHILRSNRPLGLNPREQIISDSKITDVRGKVHLRLVESAAFKLKDNSASFLFAKESF